MISLSEADFHRMYVYIQKHYGIDLSKKKQLIISRLSNTLAKMGYTDFTRYVDDLVSSRKPEMVTDMLNKLTTNYTYFMREEEHFNYLYQTVLPDLAKKHAHDKVLSIWSAGCSSGEEPYTISMYLKDYFGSQASAWDTRILATDISQNILDIFRPFNLMAPIQFKRPFDIIFCRNVMIYFDMPTKDALVRRFYQATVPGGYLFIGHSESLGKENCPYNYIVPAIYRRCL